MSDTKQAFYENFKKPVAPVYNTVIQELLVQQHLVRWNSTYQYDEVCSLVLCLRGAFLHNSVVCLNELLAVQVFALGFVSVFDQIIEGLPGDNAAEIFQAYVKAIQEDPDQYRR